MLTADGRRGVPAPPAAQGRVRASRQGGRSERDRRYRAARHRGRTRRYIGNRPDQGGANARQVSAGGQEEISDGEGRRPLRNLQRPQMARGEERKSTRLNSSP